MSDNTMGSHWPGCESEHPECAKAQPKAGGGSALRIVKEQANDSALWSPETATEAYVVHELRRLHAAVEADNGPAPAGERECPICKLKNGLMEQVRAAREGGK